MRWVRSLRADFGRLLVQTEGQDLIEYALLSATFGIGALAALTTLADAMGVAYADWLSGAQDLWEAPDPSGGGS
jgi:hypothetical protein